MSRFAAKIRMNHILFKRILSIKAAFIFRAVNCFSEAVNVFSTTGTESVCQTYRVSRRAEKRKAGQLKNTFE